jgi:hypothetical protein
MVSHTLFPQSPFAETLPRRILDIPLGNAGEAGSHDRKGVVSVMEIFLDVRDLAALLALCSTQRGDAG